MSELTADQRAAHAFLSELRTRIATQPLPYQHGAEVSALQSLWAVFAQARDAMKANPGCAEFAQLVTDVLNLQVRPVTAKWDAIFERGRLTSRDGADLFRADLEDVQHALRALATDLHAMVYGSTASDPLSPPALSDAQLEQCFAPLEFGIPVDTTIALPHVTEINASERAEVIARRTHYRLNANAAVNAVGLALSGGGIRSGTFCLGVVQVLAEKGLLRYVDFLSTVSGGGYVGALLTARLGAGGGETDVAAPDGPDPDPIRYLRQNAKFLAARTLKESWSMVVATVAGMLLNWAVPLALILIAAAAVVLFNNLFPEADLWPHLTAVAGWVTLVALVLYGAVMPRGRRITTCAGRLLGTATAIAAFCLLGWVLQIGYDVTVRVAGRSIAAHRAVSLSVAFAAAATIAPAMMRFLPLLKSPSTRTIVLKITLWLAGVIVPVAAILLFYLACYWGHHNLNTGRFPGWIVLFLCSAILAAIGWAVDINYTSPHRLYKDGLARTFVQSGIDEEPLALTTVNATHGAPYHLINATLNIPTSINPAVRDRRCDFFTFSKNWTGSPSTEFAKTAEWQTSSGDVDLATAIAVSGAAFSSYMGLGSLPTLTALLTLLNVRLGYWIRRPGAHRYVKAVATRPGFFCLLREMLGIGMSERASWLNLSDGGHIENLGIYELLRRRCKYIVAVDGEADPELTFHGLTTVIRHAQIDFGVQIEPQLDWLRRDPVANVSQSHYHFCRIHYPGNSREHPNIGLLLYLKLSVTGNENELIRRYRHTYPEFPHQSTLDQFFDQEQFEAYRELGVHVADGLFSKRLMNNRGDPGTVEEWFRRLAGNLLRPVGT